MFSALAIAACSTFFTSWAMRRLEKVSSASALAASMPRISLRDEVQLARADAQRLRKRLRLVVRKASAAVLLLLIAHFLFAFLSTAWP